MLTLSRLTSLRFAFDPAGFLTAGRTLRSTATAGFLVGGDVWLQPEEAAAT